MKPEGHSRWNGPPPPTFPVPFRRHGEVHRPAPSPAHFCIILDASPWGLGGLLVHRQSRSLLEFFSSPIDARDEATLGINIGESSSQGAVEALHCGCHLLVGQEAQRQGATGGDPGDSSVALAMARKLASASPATNFLGAVLALALGP